MRCLTGLLLVLSLYFCSPAYADSTRVSVLAYHAISLNPDRGNLSVVSLPRFEQQMRFLAESGFRTLSLEELHAFMNGAPVPERTVVISFDDGWKSQLNALPVLERYGLKASFFIFPGGGIERTSHRYRNYMTWDEVREISDHPNFEVQAHSMTHPYVRSDNLVTWVRGDTPGRNGKDAIYELVESKALLERELGVPIDFFAWPGGWYNSDLIEMAKRAGYRALFTAEGGGNRPGNDVYRMRRFMVDGACPLRIFKRTVLEHRHFPCPPAGSADREAVVQAAHSHEVLPE